MTDYLGTVDWLANGGEEVIEKLDELRVAVFNEWGHDWRTESACRRVLGDTTFENLERLRARVSKEDS